MYLVEYNERRFMTKIGWLAFSVQVNYNKQVNYVFLCRFRSKLHFKEK
jgi:hypothetical protein